MLFPVWCGKPSLHWWGYGVLSPVFKNTQLPLNIQAAFEAQGRTSEEGMASWEWYKKNQTHMGVSYMDSAQDFTGFMSNAMGVVCVSRNL